MTAPLAQDPDERFDVVTPDGAPTGIVKRRADIHRDGDWHRAIHVWVYGRDRSGPWLLMNQRGRHKDTWPRALDTTVGGHLAAGESVEHAFREIEEEIGITADQACLLHIGRRVQESVDDQPGVIDREIQEIFLLRDDRPLEDFRPNPAELEGLVRISLDDAILLYAGDMHSVPGQLLRADDGMIEDIQVDQALLIPTDDNYFLRVARAGRAAIQGHANIAL